MKVPAQKQSKPQQQALHNVTRTRAKPPAANHLSHTIPYLQRTIGNRAVQQLLRTNAEGPEVEHGSSARTRSPHDFSRIPVKIQTKPTSSMPEDIYEKEADRAADQVMNTAVRPIQHQVQPGEERKAGEGIQTKQPANKVTSPLHFTATTGVPVIVHEVINSSGQPLDPATRDFMEPRFGHDFSGVRVHTDGAAARSAEAVAAEAYTVGSDIVFGAGRYAPASPEGQRLLAHELAHVRQQQHSRPAVQRQSLPGQQSQTIPTELRSSANVGQMSDQELIERHDLILQVLGQFTVSTPATAILENEAARIGVELARRKALKALAAGRTFSEDSIKKMKEYFIKNAKKPAKPEKNPPPAPPGGWQDSCIVALNQAMKVATDKPTLPTTPVTIEKTMALIAASGHSGVAREVWFKGKGGRISRSGSLRPEKPQASIWDTVLSLAGGDPGWSVFTMSILDGYHSVTLTLDASNPSVPHLYWSDQWGIKGGWKEYTRSGLDTEVTHLVQTWWDKILAEKGKKFNTVVRVWRVSAKAEPSSGP